MSDTSQGDGWWQASDGKWYPPAAVPGVSSLPPPPTAPAPVVSKVPGVILLVAGGLAVLGSFLPWIKLTAPFVGTISKAGIDGGGDGIFTAALGVGLGILGLTHLQRRATRGALIGGTLLSLALGALTAFEFWDASSRFADASAESDLIITSYGSGLYVLAFAAVVGIVGVVQASQNRAG